MSREIGRENIVCDRHILRQVNELERKIMSQPPERGIWHGMIYRCYNRKTECWKYYGGRGITVCDRWRASFDNFLADIGPRPSPKHSIDRIDSDGNYEPGNCRWATGQQQAETRRPWGSTPERNIRYVIENLQPPDEGHCTNDWLIFLAREQLKIKDKSEWAKEMRLPIGYLRSFLDGRRKPRPTLLKALGFEPAPYYRRHENVR